MKKRSLVVMAVTLLMTALMCTSLSIAQSQGKPSKLPPFRIKQANGNIYKAENLPLGKPVLLFYFSPDCDHCTTLMNEFFKRVEDFKKASIVMVTYLPVERVNQFNEEYKVERYPNLVIGTEGMTFFVRNYYNVMNVPFAALHDKNGSLIKSYSRDIPLKDLSNRLNTLK